MQLPEATDRLLTMGAYILKRKGEDASLPPTKRFKATLPRMITEDENSSVSLRSLGENWTGFFEDHFSEVSRGLGDSSSADKGYRILALVHALGSPKVMVSLSKILRRLRKEPSQPKNWTQTAMKLYEEAEIGSIYYTMQKLAAAMYMHRQYQKKRDHFQNSLYLERMNRRKSKTKRGEGRGVSAESHAQAELTAEYVGCRLEEMDGDVWRKHKRYIQRVCKEGREACELEEASGPIWLLIPPRPILSPLLPSGSMVDLTM